MTVSTEGPSPHPLVVQLRINVIRWRSLVTRQTPPGGAPDARTEQFRRKATTHQICSTARPDEFLVGRKLAGMRKRVHERIQTTREGATHCVPTSHQHACAALAQDATLCLSELRFRFLRNKFRESLPSRCISVHWNQKTLRWNQGKPRAGFPELPRLQVSGTSQDRVGPAPVLHSSRVCTSVTLNSTLQTDGAKVPLSNSCSNLTRSPMMSQRKRSFTNFRHTFFFLSVTATGRCHRVMKMATRTAVSADTRRFQSFLWC